MQHQNWTPPGANGSRMAKRLCSSALVGSKFSSYVNLKAGTLFNPCYLNLTVFLESDYLDASLHVMHDHFPLNSDCTSPR
jgi:hypothetical protein